MAVLPPDPVFSLHAPDIKSFHSICFNCYQNPQQILAGTQNGKIFLWDLMSNRLQSNFTVGESSILNMHHTVDKLYTQEKGENIKIWARSESTYSVEKKLESDYCGFCRFCISDDGAYMFGPEKDAKVNVWSSSGEKITSLSLDNDLKLGEVMCLKYLKILSNQFILVAYESGDLYIWDLKTYKHVSNIKLIDFPLALDYDTILGRGVCGNASENIQVFSISNNDLKISLKCDIIIKNPGVNVLKIRPDKKVFVSGGWDGRLRVYSWKSLRPLAVLTEHKASIQDVCYSNEPISLWNSPIMAAGGLDSIISLWDIYNR